MNSLWANKVLVWVKPPENPSSEESEYRAMAEYIRAFYTAPTSPPFDPEEIIGNGPEQPPSSHEDVYEVMKTRVEIQSKAWIEEHSRSKKEIQRLRLELKCARDDIKARDRTLEKRDSELAELRCHLKRLRE
jgi:hypothetical protein